MSGRRVDDYLRYPCGASVRLGDYIREPDGRHAAIVVAVWSNALRVRFVESGWRAEYRALDVVKLQKWELGDFGIPV